MSSLESRLRQCFSTVFPDVAPHDIQNMTLDSTPQWDSLATVILVTVLEEQFGFSIDPSDLVNLTSFRSILEYLRERQRKGAAGVPP